MIRTITFALIAYVAAFAFACATLLAVTLGALRHLFKIQDDSQVCCAANTGLAAEPTSAGGSVTIVPPLPSLAMMKLAVEY